MTDAAWRRRFACALLLGALLLRILSTRDVAAQLAPAVRDRVVPATIEVALIADVTVNGQAEHDYLPMGSGTIVAPDGLVLTAWHVVDPDRNRREIDRVVADAKAQGTELAVTLDPDHVLLLTSDARALAAPTWIAAVAVHDATLDLAVLRIDADAQGQPLSPAMPLPFVPLGDSATVGLGDPIHVFGYPSIGDDALTYTAGVVSGFGHEAGVADPAWIMTDATLSGGSSGGTAVDASGRLVGVPTQGTQLDCRPGDTNGDGRIDAQDVGCIPVGGSIGQLRPINLARPLLTQAGFDESSVSLFPSPATSTLPVEGKIATATAIAEEYLATEDTCRGGPVYPVGTQVEVVVEEAEALLPAVDQFGNAASFPVGQLPTGTKLKTVGPFKENGMCDLWPVEVLSVPPPNVIDQILPGYPFDSVGPVANPKVYIDERAIRPG